MYAEYIPNRKKRFQPGDKALLTYGHWQKFGRLRNVVVQLLFYSHDYESDGLVRIRLFPQLLPDDFTHPPYLELYTSERKLKRLRS